MLLHKKENSFLVSQMYHHIRELDVVGDKIRYVEMNHILLTYRMERKRSSRILTLATRRSCNITFHAPTALNQYQLNRGRSDYGVGLDVVTEIKP